MKGIRYKDTTAMPGSELFKLLSEGKAKEAERSYQATAQRERDLLATYTTISGTLLQS